VIILSQVQTLLQRDKVVWTSGFLATPSARDQGGNSVETR